jgi:hypothetical protein
VQVANKLLDAIHKGDHRAYLSLLNKVNMKKMGGLPEKLKDDLADLKKKVGNVRKVSELRRAPPDMGNGTVLARVRTEGREVYVITLTREAGGYRFEDLNSPSVTDYQKLKKLWP